MPRDELKDNSIGIARAALPGVGTPADSIPYYYVLAAQMVGAGMMVAKHVYQTALYAAPPCRSVAYLWSQAQEQQQGP